MKLKDKVAIVTGAGRGIGEAIATRFVEEGAAVVVADINYDDIEAVVKKLEAMDGRVIKVHANVSYKNNWDLIMEKCLDKFGTVDILVNNAGIIRDARLVKMKEEAWDVVIDVNLKGTFLGCQAVMPIMLEKSYGKIVNISSVSRFGNYGQANYAASKAGVVGLTRSLAKELGPQGININAIAPGAIMTDMFKSVPDVVVEGAKNITAVKRLGEAHEIASACLFFASDEAAFITGQVLHVDGGMFMP